MSENPNYWREVDPPMSFIPEKWTYEQKRAFRYRELDYLHDAVDFPSFAGKRVLCIGDGSGIDAVEFARNGAHVDVIDMSEKAIQLTLRHAIEAGRDRSLPVNVGHLLSAHVGDARDIRFADGTFDLVYSFGVFHHIVEVDKAVKEVARVLKPGGRFMGMVYHQDSLYYAYSILLRAEREGISPEEAMRLWSERNPGCPHSVAYTRAALIDLLKESGLPTSVVRDYYDVIDTARQRKVRLGTLELGLGWHLFFTATK